MKRAMGVPIVALGLVAGCGRAVLDTTAGGGCIGGAGGAGPWIPPANRNESLADRLGQRLPPPGNTP